jgi:hypothetical protein
MPFSRIDLSDYDNNYDVVPRFIRSARPRNKGIVVARVSVFRRFTMCAKKMIANELLSPRMGKRAATNVFQLASRALNTDTFGRFVWTSFEAALGCKVNWSRSCCIHTNEQHM